MHLPNLANLNPSYYVNKYRKAPVSMNVIACRPAITCSMKKWPQPTGMFPRYPYPMNSQHTIFTAPRGSIEALAKDYEKMDLQPAIQLLLHLEVKLRGLLYGPWLTPRGLYGYWNTEVRRRTRHVRAACPNSISHKHTATA